MKYLAGKPVALMVQAEGLVYSVVWKEFTVEVMHTWGDEFLMSIIETAYPTGLIVEPISYSSLPLALKEADEVIGELLM